MTTRTTARQRRSRRQTQTGRTRAVLVTLLVLGIVGAVFVAATSNRSHGIQAEAGNARFDYDPVLGDPAAPVTIIEYGAYGCSACRAWHRAGIIEQVLAEFPGQVRFVFRDFPVIVPAYDQMAAEVAQCALDQKSRRILGTSQSVVHGGIAILLAV